MTESPERSRVLTLVFTDLADSTALKTERGDVAVGELISRHRAHVTRLAESCSGRIIDWAGDGCFLTFETSSAGVMFALQLEQAHADENDLPGVRIGIHMGEVTEKPGPGEAPRIEGLAVDIAARISGLSKPGQVLMSASVHNSARQRLGVESFGQPILWQAHGTYELKGFDEPMEIREAGLEGLSPLEAPTSGEKAKLVRKAPKTTQGNRTAKPSSATKRPTTILIALTVIVLLVGAIAYLLGSRTATEPGISEVAVLPTSGAESSDSAISVAVLPFTGNSEQEFFVDGMTEELISALNGYRSLKVHDRTSVMRFKNTTMSTGEIANELGVDYMIEGSVRREENTVRIIARLIDASTGDYRWDGAYNNSVTSVLKLHAEMALVIAREIGATLSPDEVARVAESKEVNEEAYEQVLMGKFASYQNSPQGFAEAASRARRALELDPDYVDAYALLAAGLWVPSAWGWANPQDNIAEVKQALADGYALDPSNTDILSTSGWLALGFDYDWEKAERYFNLAIESNADKPWGDAGISWLRSIQREPEAAITAARHAVNLDPYNPAVLDLLEDAYAAAGRYEEAIEWGERALRIDPDNVGNLINQMERYAEVGREEDFRRTWQHLASLDDIQAIQNAYHYAGCLALLGLLDEAREVFDEASKDPQLYASPYALAYYYVSLGDEDKLFEALEMAYEQQKFGMLLLNTAWTTIFDPYRDHPRFQALIEKMNYPEPSAQ